MEGVEVVGVDPTTDIACLREPAAIPVIMKDGTFVRDALPA